MSKTFPIFFGIAIALLGLGMWLGWFGTSDLRLQVTGELLKVRSVEMTPDTTLVVVDFRMRNDSGLVFTLRDAVLLWTDAQGKEQECDHVAGADLKRVLQHMPQVGPMFNQPFVTNDTVQPKAMMDRMISGVAKVSEQAFEKRKNVRLRITDIDRKTFTFDERGQPSAN